MEDNKWYSLDTVDAEATNEFGGTIKVTNVEQKDGELYFTVEKEGFNPLIDRSVIIRNPEDPMNFCVATEDMTQDGKFIVFFKDRQVNVVSENCTNKVIQYSVMEPITYTIATEKIEMK